MKLTLETNFTPKEFAAACRAAAETCGLSRCPVAPAFKCPLLRCERIACAAVNEKDWLAVAEKEKDTK